MKTIVKISPPEYCSITETDSICHVNSREIEVIVEKHNGVVEIWLGQGVLQFDKNKESELKELRTLLTEVGFMLQKIEEG